MNSVVINKFYFACLSVYTNFRDKNVMVERQSMKFRYMKVTITNQLQKNIHNFYSIFEYRAIGITGVCDKKKYAKNFICMREVLLIFSLNSIV